MVCSCPGEQGWSCLHLCQASLVGEITESKEGKKLPRDLTIEPEKSLLAFFPSYCSKVRPFPEITCLLNTPFRVRYKVLFLSTAYERRLIRTLKAKSFILSYAESSCRE